MRKILARSKGKRLVFRGCFDHFGEKPGWRGSPEKTVLLLNVVGEYGEPVCDHIWFNLTKQFDSLDLKHGDIVEFHARVKLYEKGYKGRREDVYKPVERDYKLIFPTQIKKIIA